MALDATIGGASADTYGTLAEADAYFAARQTGNWDGSDASKEMALRRAATYLDNVYRGAWKGTKATSTQIRAWPRVNVVDVDGYGILGAVIPTELKYAQFEAANLIAGGTDLEGTVGRATKSETVGPLSVTYMDGASARDQYVAVHNYLRGLTIGTPATGGGFGSGAVVRA